VSISSAPLVTLADNACLDGLCSTAGNKEIHLDRFVEIKQSRPEDWPTTNSQIHAGMCTQTNHMLDLRPAAVTR